MDGQITYVMTPSPAATIGLLEAITKNIDVTDRIPEVIYLQLILHCYFFTSEAEYWQSVFGSLLNTHSPSVWRIIYVHVR